MKFLVIAHCSPGHSQTEDSKSSELSGPGWRRVAELCLGIQGWVFMNGWSVCAKSFLLPDIYILRLFTQRNLPRLANTPHTHTMVYPIGKLLRFQVVILVAVNSTWLYCTCLSVCLYILLSLAAPTQGSKTQTTRDVAHIFLFLLWM